MMTETLKKLAEVRRTTPEHIAALTTANFERLCGGRYTGNSHGN
jgi:Tat protein secretion system quality control protein TatD with DNase activity